MSSRLQVWSITGVLFAATCVRCALTFLDYPDRTTAALIQWSVVALWLVVPLLGVWRQLAAIRGNDESFLRAAALRIAILGYVPTLLSMGLIDRLAGQPH
jgi:hypothetical protein